MFFLLIIFGIVLLDVLWWVYADRFVRPLRGARWWRVGVGVFALVQLLGFASVFLVRVAPVSFEAPAWLMAELFVWHLLVLPATMTLIVLGTAGVSLSKLAGRVAPQWFGVAGPGGTKVHSGTDEEPASAVSLTVASPVRPLIGPTRREVLLAGIAAVPPLLTFGTVAGAMARLSDLRIRTMAIGIAGLPAALEGLTIAHLSDTHVGRFTPDEKLDRIVEQTNALDADLVLFTGDLIDYSLRDLPAALDMIKRLRGKLGVYLCEGNHDLFEARSTFESEVKRAGVTLLLNEEESVSVRGQRVQVMGLKWGGARHRRDGMYEEHLREVLKLRRPDSFPILLAHHPHAFDPAAEAGIPLTLAGHTHGGQVMATENFGPGPMMFKYWSGLYQRAGSSLVVSNGVGNWFPLRVNAPAEIVHLTLRRG